MKVDLSGLSAALLRGPRDAAHDVHRPAAAARAAGRALLAAVAAAEEAHHARPGARTLPHTQPYSNVVDLF